MKKFYFFWAILFALVLTGCQHEDVVSNMAEKESVDGVRSMEDAMKIAQQFVDDENLDSRSGVAAPRKVKSACLVSKTGSRSGGDQPSVYAVDYEDNQGFCLVAASEDVEPILAVVDSGSYGDPENLTNELYQMMLSDIVSYAAHGPTLPTLPVPIKPAFTLDTVYVNKKVGPSIKVEWAQGWPENLYAPNKIAGCGPIAAAQILSVFETPSSMNLTFSGAPTSSISINWRDLKKHKHSSGNLDPIDEEFQQHRAECTASSDAHNTLGLLVRQIGQKMFAMYEDGGTGIYDENFEDFLRYTLSGKTYTWGRDMNTLYTLILEKGGVAGISGIDGISNIGHAWTIDGAWEKGYMVYAVSDNMIYDDPDKIVREVHKDSRTKLLHHNWGWGGNCNGYFLSTVLDPRNGNTYDNSDTTNRVDWACTLVKSFHHFE